MFITQHEVTQRFVIILLFSPHFRSPGGEEEVPEKSCSASSEDCRVLAPLCDEGVSEAATDPVQPAGANVFTSTHKHLNVTMF